MDGEWYQSEMDLLATRIKPGDVVIDVGANIGCQTLFFATMVGSNGLVIAFEPQHYSFQLLCANVALVEIDVVKGARHLISKTRPTVYCECKQTEQSNHLVALIHSLSYDVYEHLAPGWNPSNFLGNRNNAIHGDCKERNLLCLPAGTPLEVGICRDYDSSHRDVDITSMRRGNERED
jgi:hypothetical protein